MRPISLRWTMLIVVLAVIASCGGGSSGSDSPVCTPSQYMVLYDSISGTNLLTSVTISALHSTGVSTVPVFVAYTSPPVAAIVAGYPPGGTDPRAVGMDIAIVGSSAANPLEFDLSFDSSQAAATYTATWRFVAVDAYSNIAGCQDLPVTFTIQ